MVSLPPFDITNIQGDVLDGLPKKAETFYFFTIKNVHVFRTQLASVIPLITTVPESQAARDAISNAKKQAAQHGREPQLVEMTALNISFSHKGLIKLGLTEDLGDTPFKRGMKVDAEDSLGDDLKQWDDAFLKKEIDGVIVITGNSLHNVHKELQKVTSLFHSGHKDAGIVEVTKIDGHTRPDDESGHEHFGFNDGMSQPAVEGIPTPFQKGQETVRQGVIFIGRDGDKGDAGAGQAEGDGTIKRPSWALDGSFLAFRYLKQLVPEFDAFLNTSTLSVPKPQSADDPTAADLLGARLVGRWKSGAPVDSTPHRDNPALAAFEHNQDFTYDPLNQQRCPFAAHTRKTNPRADLEDKRLGNLGGTEVRRIIRRGIQFGPEVTSEEKQHRKSSSDPKLERGLLFACYQSNINNGFEFLQKTWANNEAFPPKTSAPVKPLVPTPGIDPIIGVAIDGTPRQLVGSDPLKPLTELDVTNKWVIPRGGEYFFVPSISTLREKFAAAAPRNGENGHDEL